MKRKNNLYLDNINYQNIYQEYLKVKSSCRSDRKLFDFRKNLHTNILDIEKKLLSRSYQFDKGFLFLIKEPKYRIIISESVSDKIANHFIADYLLMPVLDKCLINTNVATRKEKGASFAYQYMENYVNKIGLKNNIYVLKMDVSKYFYNLDHNYLKSQIRKKIKDPDALKIIDMVIDNTNRDYVNECITNLKKHEINRINYLNISQKERDLKIRQITEIPEYKYNKGLAIGNICSQILAVFYLNDLDHYIKEDLKCKYYIRYMDDLVIFDKDKEKLKKIFDLIKKKIENVFLKVNSKSNIYLLNNSFTFLGYTYHIYNQKLYKKCRNSTYNKIQKKLRFFKTNDYEKYFLSIISYKGYLGKHIINYEKEYNYISDIFKKYIIIYDFNNKLIITGDNKKIVKKYYIKNHYIKAILKKLSNYNYVYLKENKMFLNNGKV